jgi:hypothetical protein
MSLPSSGSKNKPSMEPEQSNSKQIEGGQMVPKASLRVQRRISAAPTLGYTNSLTDEKLQMKTGTQTTIFSAAMGGK